MKNWCLTALFLCYFLAANSQKLYIEPYFGYGFGIQKNYYDAVSVHGQMDYNYEEVWYIYKLYKLSFGQGFRYGINVGSDISKNFSLELGFEYFKGKPQKLTEYETIEYIDAGEVEMTYNYDFEGKYFMFKPALVISKKFEWFRPFAKIGAYLGQCSLKQNMDMNLINSLPGYYPFEDVTSEFKFENRFSAGYFISFGCEHNAFDNLKISLELLYGSLNYVPTKGEYIKYTYRGDDYLDELDTHERFVEYVDDYDSRDNLISTEPAKELKQKHSFSHLVINFGIRIIILNKKESSIN